MIFERNSLLNFNVKCNKDYYRRCAKIGPNSYSFNMLGSLVLQMFPRDVNIL
jgi:hypothetical protein